MKKIALTIGHYAYRGGLEKYTRQLAKAFASRNCQVTVLTTGVGQSHDNIEVISLGNHSSFTLYQLLHFESLCQKWLKAHPQDLVFGMERNRQQDVYRAGSGVHRVYLERRKKVEGPLKALSLSLNPLHKYLCAAEKALFESPSLRLLFTNSNMVKEEICSYFSTDPQKIEVVHNGVEHQKYETPFLERSFDRKGPYHFLFVGNGYGRKGLGFLLPALAQLQEKEWQLSVVGKDKNMATFQQIAEKCRTGSKIHFYGPQTDLIPFYQRADALLLPSLYDPFANVTLEALSLGLFVVTSSFNGAAEILTPTLGTVIDDLFDRGSIVSSLEEALATKRDQASYLARRQAIAHLDFSHQLEKIVAKTLSGILSW